MDSVFESAVLNVPLAMPAGLQKGYVGPNTVPGPWSYHSLVMEIVKAIDAGVPLTALAREPSNVSQLGNIITKIIERLASADTNLNTAVPIGSIIPWIGSKAPPNYIVADGREYNRSGAGSYPKLTDVVLNNATSGLQVFTKATWNTIFQGAFNTGNGSTTIGVPFLRSLILKGSADGDGWFTYPESQTRISGQFEDQALLGHAHSLNTQNWTNGGAGGTSYTPSGSSMGAATSTNAAGGNQNLVRTMGVLWCIRAA